MPTKSDRRKLRVFRRTAKGTVMVVKGKKHAKLRCALCDGVLNGVPHGMNSGKRKTQSKTSKAPSGVFAGILCGTCRSMVIIETAKMKSGMKPMNQIDLRVKPYVEQLDKKVNA